MLTSSITNISNALFFLPIVYFLPVSAEERMRSKPEKVQPRISWKCDCEQRNFWLKPHLYTINLLKVTYEASCDGLYQINTIVHNANPHKALPRFSNSVCGLAKDHIQIKRAEGLGAWLQWRMSFHPQKCQLLRMTSNKSPVNAYYTTKSHRSSHCQVHWHISP